MLRRRPHRCPYCGHDVRGRLRCGHCGELLPEDEASSRAVQIPAPVAAVGSTVFGVGIAVAALVQPLVALALAVGVPVVLGVGAAASSSLARWTRARARRSSKIPPRGESLVLARQTLATSPDARVTVRGRVRVELPVLERTDDAVRGGRAGRFVVETDAGEALVDDEHIATSPELVVHDGDLVEVSGPARLVQDSTVAADYRGAAPTRLVFDATEEHPLEIRRV